MEGTGSLFTGQKSSTSEVVMQSTGKSRESDYHKIFSNIFFVSTKNLLYSIGFVIFSAFSFFMGTIKGIFTVGKVDI